MMLSELKYFCADFVIVTLDWGNIVKRRKPITFYNTPVSLVLNSCTAEDALLVQEVLDSSSKYQHDTLNIEEKIPFILTSQYGINCYTDIPPETRKPETGAVSCFRTGIRKKEPEYPQFHNSTTPCTLRYNPHIQVLISEEILTVKWISLSYTGYKDLNMVMAPSS